MRTLAEKEPEILVIGVSFGRALSSSAWGGVKGRSDVFCENRLTGSPPRAERMEGLRACVRTTFQIEKWSKAAEMQPEEPAPSEVEGATFGLARHVSAG